MADKKKEPTKAELDAQKVAAEKEKKAGKRKPGHYVCKGKSITSTVGLLDEGQLVKEGVFNKEQLARLTGLEVVEVEK